MTRERQNFEDVLRAVAPAIQALRRGEGVVLAMDGDSAYLVRAAELADATAPLEPEEFLAITGARAEKLGLAQGHAPSVRITLPAGASGDSLALLINPAVAGKESLPRLAVETGGGAEHLAICLAKYGALLPAVIMSPLPASADVSLFAQERGMIVVPAESVSRYKEALAMTLTPISEAKIPLKAAVDARVIAFRPYLGAADHLAIIIGAPEKEKAPLVRVHSSCLTGDLLGSLRCDCGDQLQGAIEAIAQEGSGVILYLNQEGRGIGIVNKLRAYALQDAGFDTVDANEEIGFDADERHFQPAAEMLRQLGISAVRLLTNNPRKVEELMRHGIRVVAREPLVVPPNPHNQFYLDTKARRCGHVF